jgi:hypothetical protein
MKTFPTPDLNTYLKREARQNNIYIFSPYLKVSTTRFQYSTVWLLLFREIVRIVVRKL